MRTGDIDSCRDRIHVNQSDDVVALKSEFALFDIIVSVHLFDQWKRVGAERERKEKAPCFISILEQARISTCSEEKGKCDPNHDNRNVNDDDDKTRILSEQGEWQCE